MLHRLNPMAWFQNEIFFSKWNFRFKMKFSFQKSITNFRTLFNFKIVSEQKIFIFEHGWADGVGICDCTVSSWYLPTRNVLSINRPEVCCNLDYFVVLIVYIGDGYDEFLSFSIRNSSLFDRAVEPCDDFYEFACGKWNETEPIPEDRGRWGVFDILRRKLSGTLQSRTFLNPQRSLINHELSNIFLTFFFSSVGCHTSNHCTTQRHAKNAGLLPYVSRRRWIRQTRTSRKHFCLQKICLLLSSFVFFCLLLYWSIKTRWDLWSIVQPCVFTHMRCIMILPLGRVMFNFRLLIFLHFIVALNDASNLELLKNHIKDIFPQFEQFPWSEATIPTMRQNFEAVMQARKFGLTLDLFSNYISSDHESPRRNLIAFSASGQERTLYFNSTDARYIAYRTYFNRHVSAVHGESEARIVAARRGGPVRTGRDRFRNAPGICTSDLASKITFFMHNYQLSI